MTQIATRKDKPPSATLFSSKDGHSASKAEIGSTAGQHGAEKASGHLSTQGRCDAGYGVDLRRTVSRQATRINPELPDEGTKPTSQDFLQLRQDTQELQNTPGGCSTSQTTIFTTAKVSTECPMDENKHPGRVFIDRRSGAHGLGVPTKQALQRTQ